MPTPTWINDFKTPPAIFKPVPFWSWNERMEPDEVKHQIAEMDKAGWGGGFVHSRIGLTTPYLGEEWFKAVDAAIEGCRAHGMKVWLYDEDKWPSGFSGGSVPLANENFRQKCLVARKAGVPVTPAFSPIGQPVDGLQVYRWLAPLGHDWFNGTCYADLMDAAAMRKFLDDAYESYYKRYADHYGTDIVAEFTDEPCSMVRNRIPAGAVPFTDSLIERFKALWGYDPSPKLHLLFVQSDDAPKFRLHYFRTVNDLFETNFSKQLGDWCDEHGIDLTGHYMCEHGLYDQQNWGVKIMPNYRHEGIPGIDHLARQIEERISAKQCQSVVNQYGKKRMLSELYGVAGGSLSFEDRIWIASQQMCLGVNLLNPHLSLYTMSGCRKRDYPQNMYYPQPWWPLNRVCDDQLSRTCVALSQGKYIAEALVIHPQESTFVLWRSKSAPSPAGDDMKKKTVFDIQSTETEVAPLVAELDKQVKAVIDTLLGAQRTFDFGDETIIGQVARVVSVGVERPVVRIEQMDYPLVIIPGMQTIAAPTVDLLKRFQQAGGPVYRCGTAPTYLEGERSADLDRWLQTVPEIQTADIPEIVRKHVPPMVELIDTSRENAELLWIHPRALDGGDRLIYLTNLSRTRAFTAPVKFSGDFKSASLLDTATGDERPIQTRSSDHALIVEMTFAPTQNYIVRLSRDPAGANPITLRAKKTTQSTESPASAWKVERLDDNAITLDFAEWREGNGQWSKRALPLVSIQERLNELKYDGPLTLRYHAKASKLSPSRKVHLVVEYPARYRISVNGKEVKYAGLPFWRDIRFSPIDITGLLNDGDNVIELHNETFQYGNLASVHDQFRRYGTEIESIYLVGDFSVDAKLNDEKRVCPWWEKFQLPSLKSHCFDENSLVIADPKPVKFGDTTTQGLPFYPGRLKLLADLPASAQNGNALLEIEHLDAAVAEVSVDGKTVGYFVTHPLQVKLPAGKQVSITLYGTLRNLLGPHHHVMGEMPSVGPQSFHPKYPEDIGRPQFVEQWANGQTEAPDWRDGYNMVSFGDTGKITISKAE
jgi:hypothetical protein